METSSYNSDAADPMMTISNISPHLLTVAESAVTNFLHNDYDEIDMETENFPRDCSSEDPTQQSGVVNIKSEIIEAPIFSTPGISNFNEEETPSDFNQPTALTANEVPIFPGDKHEFTPERLFKGVIYLAAERRYTRTRGVKLDIAARTYLSRLTGLYLRQHNYQLDANGEEFIKFFMTKTVLIGQPDGLTANQKQELFIILRDAYRNRRRTILRKERLVEAQSPSFLEKKPKLSTPSATNDKINDLLESMKASTDESDQALTNDLLSAITFLNSSQSDGIPSLSNFQFSQSGDFPSTSIENNVPLVNESSSSHEKSVPDNSPLKLQTNTNLIEDYAKTVKSSHELLMKVTSALTESHEKLLTAQSFLINTQPLPPLPQTPTETSAPSTKDTSLRQYDVVDLDVYNFKLGMIVDFLVSEPGSIPMYLIGLLTGILVENVQVKILELEDGKENESTWISVGCIRKCFSCQGSLDNGVPTQIQTICLQSRPYDGD